MSVLILYINFWGSLSGNIEKNKDFIELCDKLMCKNKNIKKLFKEMFLINKSNISLESIEYFYYNNILFKSYVKSNTNNILQVS